MADTNPNNVEALLRALRQPAEASFTDVEGIPIALIPPGYSAEDFERLLQQPSKIVAHPTLAEAASFISYWKRFADQGSVIFANLPGQKFTAVFDYHRASDPAWCKHKCTFKCTLATEWETWTRQNDKPMSQRDFAAFVEMNAVDIVTPAAADMLQIALTLKADKKVTFSSGVRLDNGQVQLTYNEKINGTAGPTGNLSIPERFDLGIRVFQGGDKYKVQAYLRYRITDGVLTFAYQLIRPERMLEDAFEQVREHITKGCTDATIFAEA